MNHLRALMVAATSALLVAAVIGPASAAAETKVCAVGEPEAAPPCASGEKEYKAKTILFSLARGNAVFSSGAGTVECNESSAEGALFGTGSKEGSLGKFSWSNNKSSECPSTIPGVKSARLEAIGLSWTILFEWLNNSTLKKNPNAIVTLHKVLLRLILGSVVCTYKADMEKSESYSLADEKVLTGFFNHDNTSSGLAEVHYEEILLVDNPTDSMTCPGLVKYSAEYLAKGEGEETELAVRG